MTVTIRTIIEHLIEDMLETKHSGAAMALRYSVGTHLIQEWMAGRLFTDEDVSDMMKDARKEGYEEGMRDALPTNFL